MFADSFSQRATFSHSQKKCGTEGVNPFTDDPVKALHFARLV